MTIQPSDKIARFFSYLYGILLAPVIALIAVQILLVSLILSGDRRTTHFAQPQPCTGLKGEIPEIQGDCLQINIKANAGTEV